MRPLSRNGIRMLPYPGGKQFAFTIIDDTDMATLETIRPIYEYLSSLGLRTTKTVWVTRPNAPLSSAVDGGDTLERKEYTDYMHLLQRHGFEIALHNVSSQSSTRSQVAAGMARFRDVFGDYPRLNAHHEKNRENLYFDFAQRGGRRLPTFRTPLFQGLQQLLTRNGHPPALPSACSGDDSRSEYFWGDLCRQAIKYVRTNVFFQELNTLRCNPLLPYSAPETPYVNYWFDSSNGQDVHCFNSLMSDGNTTGLKREYGCAIVYTHFGKGFVRGNRGHLELNATTKLRLEAMAGDPDGWYVPVSDLLDRLLAFQQVSGFPLGAGLALENRNSFDIPSVTLQGSPGAVYRNLTSGELVIADQKGWILLPSLPGGKITALIPRQACGRAALWYELETHPLRADLERALRKLRARWHSHA